VSLRAARFAGSWYPGQTLALSEAIRDATPAATTRPALAIVAPHAGYRYSLAIAAETYAQVAVPARAIVLCPNHTVPPPIISVWSGGSWETPLGEVPIDTELRDAILTRCPLAQAETNAHQREHAIELHLPLLQHHRPDVQIVPIVVADPDPGHLRELGEGLAGAIQDVGGDVLLVASTDMTHQQPAAVAKAQDERALDHVLALDPDGLLQRCSREQITMCGVRPTAAVIHAAKTLGATQVELVRYGNSGEASGDYDSVVGYAGLVIR
jgi:AmmeMemoRadiSam system protein B